MTQTETRKSIVSYMIRTGNALQPWAQRHQVFADAEEATARYAELKANRDARYVTISK